MAARRSRFLSGSAPRIVLVLALAAFAPAVLPAGPLPPLTAPATVATTACVAGANTLCLSNGRFQVSVRWQDFQGNTGAGNAIALTSDTGYFWFFTNTNVELVVKVLDATALNGHFWVFYGALSNVEYEITVTDTATAEHRTYSNPSGQFASAGDTLAFPTGSGSAVTAFGPALAFAGSPETGPGPGGAARGRWARAETTGCVADPTALCLADGRFRVEVNWKDFQGRTGRGQAVGLTAETGYFWFFNSANVELVVKVLDARGVNGKFWAFYGALSNVEYEVVVIDTATGESQHYRNPSGQFASAGDTAAFPLPDGAPAPAVTASGTPGGAAATATIGPAGGTLSSGDGVLTLTVPPNAVTNQVAFTIQPIDNEAPGSLGSGYRLGPEGMTFANPVQISFRYDANLSGSFADGLSLAFQDAQHFWRAVKAVERDPAHHTLTVSSAHLSDWSSLLGYALKPFKAEVTVGNSLGLSLVFCSRTDYGDELAELVNTCTQEAGDVRATNWMVNGLAGGNGTTGTVSASGDYGGTFTAPEHKPSPEVVAVSATLGRGSDHYQVVSNLTIVEDSWIGTADGGFGPASVTVQVTWALESMVNNVATYKPSGTAHYSFAGCTVTPSDGVLDTLAFLIIDYNANPPTYDGIGDGIWTALFDCPPDAAGENPVTFLYFDGAGTVGGNGKTIAGSGLSRDGVWSMHWNFVRHAPGSP